MYQINGQKQHSKKEIYKRKYFLDDQEIYSNQGHQIQFKSYAEISDFHAFILQKTICSFLNSLGGWIFLGIRQNTKNRRKNVVGIYINQKSQKIKENLHQIIQSFYPQVNHSFYQLDYIPIIRNERKIKDRYVIRIRIEAGEKKFLYSFRRLNDCDSYKNFFYKREDNQCISISSMDIIYDQIIKRFQFYSQKPQKKPQTVQSLFNQLEQIKIQEQENLNDQISSEQTTKQFHNGEQKNDKNDVCVMKSYILPKYNEIQQQEQSTCYIKFSGKVIDKSQLQNWFEQSGISRNSINYSKQNYEAKIYFTNQDSMFQLYRQYNEEEKQNRLNNAVQGGITISVHYI